MDMTQTNTLTPIEKALGFAELSEKEQQEVLVELNELIFKGTMIRVMEQMDESVKDEFHALIDSNASQDEIIDFIEANVPDSDALVQETVTDLTNDILAVTKE
jgi:hypothetical protein